MGDSKNHIEEEDREALEGLSPAPHHPPRKVHSYSQQLRTNTSPKRRHQHRKHRHSLDEDRIPNPNPNPIEPPPPSFNGYDDDDDSSSANANPPALPDPQQPPIPEFVGSGGLGIFKAPHRATVHPGRPPCIELRPHPLRETQVGKFMRNIACAEAQLWAGQESGVRVWNVDNAYEPGCGIGGRVRRGDEDAVPFHESVNTAPTFCLMADVGHKLVWSGHKDGKIRSWKMDQTFDGTPFKEGLLWQAHRLTVLSMVMTSYGDIWSGSENGVIRVWPWETIEKSLSLKPEEKHMAALLVERSCIDLKSQVTVNGNCMISSSDVKTMLCDHVRAKVWCAGSTSFSLWDARTKELLKVFNVEGQTENRVDAPPPQMPDQQPVEEEMKVKYVSTTKKEKSPGFLQRSRNAIMGAADAVRRVATRGTASFQDEVKRTEALMLAPDGVIWSGCTNGLLVQWDSNGNRLHDINLHPCAVQCFCTFGTRIYVGYVSGIVQIIDLEGNLIAGWVAHSSPVIKMAVGSGYIFSLATHGGIRAWNVASPGPIDNIIRTELATKENTYIKRDCVRIVVGTWNVGQGRAPQDALNSWLSSVASDVGIIVIGLQEVEMGAGFLAMSAAKETVGLEGSSVGQWWIDNIGKALEEGTTFERMGSRQLAGLLISLWVRKNLRKHVGDIDAAAVPCGFGRAIGNKGGVGLRLRVYDRIMCFVNCHLAAHLEAVNRRNADFDHIYRSMVFTRSSNLVNTAAAAGVSTSSHSHSAKGTNAPSLHSEDTRPELSEADMVVFLGDFNYRLFGISYDEARDFVSQRCFDWLREKDQLREEMKNGRVFQGMREALIKFPPTYKFERHKPGLAGYDSGEKKRIPAWCDRVIYRDNRMGQVDECSLECPVVSSILLYEACMDVTESDHKPVRCKFNVNIAHVDRSVRRQELGAIMKSNEKIKSILKDMRYVPDTIVNTNKITLQDQETSVLKITNKSGKDKAIYKVICEGQSAVKDDGQVDDNRPRGSFGFPRWLEVSPAAGLIKPDQFAGVNIHHADSNNHEENAESVHHNRLSEDNRDKAVVLVVTIQGSSSTKTASHRVHVRHCYSGKPKTTAPPHRVEARSNSTRKHQGSRSEGRHRRSSSDSVEYHR